MRKRIEVSDVKKAFESGEKIFRRSSVLPLLVEIEILQDKLKDYINSMFYWRNRAEYLEKVIDEFTKTATKILEEK